jgi:alkanesulfonate monooxygenase SsuD/methylene tetrahydromethanopterin reductase-like flavin-dependent oxidoreductase (luciferase family)
MDNIRRGIQAPIVMSEVADAARAAEFHDEGYARDYMVVGSPETVVERLIEIKEQAQADELVLVSPGLDRARRISSYQAIAGEWPRD